MILLPHNDVDYLGALAHARYSRMCSGVRLSAISRTTCLPDLVQAVAPGADVVGTTTFQRRMVQDLISELLAFAQSLTGPRRAFLEWLTARFEVENLKVLGRGLDQGIPPQELQPYLLRLPWQSPRLVRKLVSAKSRRDLLERLPNAVSRAWLPERKLTAVLSDPFQFESLLDRVYLLELLRRTIRVPATERVQVEPLVFQEVGIFNLMMALRGRFHYGLAPEVLQALHVAAANMSRQWFTAIAHASDPAAAAARALGIVLDALPGEAESGNILQVELLAWTRYHRLAARVFRQGHMRFAELVGYAGLRRLEVANLITVSEGIRAGFAPSELRHRLIPPVETEVPHV